MFISEPLSGDAVYISIRPLRLFFCKSKTNKSIKKELTEKTNAIMQKRYELSDATYKINANAFEIKKIKNGETVQINDQFSKEEEKTDQEQTIDVPIIGKVNLKNISIMSAAVLIGLVDGFNPCAMWVLLFLITTLISLKDKKRLLLLVSIFLLTSGFVYFLIMFSWLNIVVSVSTSIIFRYLIGVFAIGAGIYNLYNFLKGLKSDDGCEVVDKKKRKDIFKKIKKFTHEKSLLLAILGIMLLAVSVNVIVIISDWSFPFDA